MPPFPLIAAAAVKAGASFAARRALVKSTLARTGGVLGSLGRKVGGYVGIGGTARQRGRFGGGRRRRGVSMQKLMIMKMLGGSRSIAFQLALMKLR